LHSRSVKDSASLSKNPGGDFNGPGKGLEIGLSESTEAQPANHTHKINNGDRLDSFIAQQRFAFVR
jgi:hypothetical protein